MIWVLIFALAAYLFFVVLLVGLGMAASRGDRLGEDSLRRPW